MTTKNKPFDIDHLPYYVVEKTENHRTLEGRYWNSNGYQTAIVATITYFPETDTPDHVGFVGDWAAYIGASRDVFHPTEKQACKEVAGKGAKMSEKDARYFFPEITLPYRH